MQLYTILIIGNSTCAQNKSSLQGEGNRADHFQVNVVEETVMKINIIFINEQRVTCFRGKQLTVQYLVIWTIFGLKKNLCRCLILHIFSIPRVIRFAIGGGAAGRTRRRGASLRLVHRLKNMPFFVFHRYQQFIPALKT